MDVIVARGHENVTARHRTTIEVTREEDMGVRADCIIGVGADKGFPQLSSEFMQGARDEGSTIRVVFRAGGIEEVVVGRGHPDLTFEDEEEMVIRKSSFICPRTLMVKADKGARDLDRRLIELLKDGGQGLVVEISLIKEAG